MTARRPRRRLLVDPRFQSQLISSFLLIFVPAAGVLGAITWAILIDMERVGESLGIAAGHPFFQHIAQLRVAASAAMLVTLVGVVAMVVYGGLLRTRRIAGPILAARQQLERAADGEGAQQVQLRRGDYFADLLRSLNSAIKKG
jgi:hypothetical protein